jgi:putative endonuclease
LAERFLRRNGYKILYRNFRSKRGGEIDLVCRDRRENALVFVEVKTRTTEMFGAPLQAVTLAKQQRSVRAAREWLRMLDRPDLLYRFDVVEVILEKKPQIRLTRAAFFDPADVHAP